MTCSHVKTNTGMFTNVSISSRSSAWYLGLALWFFAGDRMMGCCQVTRRFLIGVRRQVEV